MPRTGDRLAGRYELLAPIGSGGFATVFRGRDLWLGREVAIKILLPNHSGDPVVAARFGREARSLAAISHPNVVAIHDVGGGEPGGSEPFIVMDLCEDGSLADALAASDLGWLSPAELVPIMVDVAAGLAALHSRGIVHRDIKPSNILFGDGRARIADLGIALAEPSELTATDTTVGTLAYLAPEQLTGEPATPASDVHALGVTAFRGLTGSLPRKTGSLAEVVAAGREPAPLVSRLAPDLGTSFDRPLERALARRPEDRPTAEQLGQDLVGAAAWPTAPVVVPAVAGDDTTVAELALAGRPDRAGRSSGTWIGVVVLLTAGAIAIAALASFAGLGPGGRPAPTSSARAVASVPATPSPNPTPSPSPSLRPTPRPTPSPTPSPTPRPTPSPDPFAAAAVASNAARSAIQDVLDERVLKRRDTRELEARLDQFDRALDDEDVGRARDEAESFAREVADRLGDESGDGAGDALRSAADELVVAAGALPD